MSTETFVWIKYRTMHSSGPSGWKHREVSLPENEVSETSEAFKDLMESLNDELSTHSEHWRGVEVAIENPPVEWLEKHIEHTRVRALELYDAWDRAGRLLNDLKA